MSSYCHPHPGRTGHRGPFVFMEDHERGRPGRRGGRGRHGDPASGLRGFGPGGPGFGRRKRGRGDIRIAILALLAEEPMHGYQVIQELSERSDGTWNPSPGSVYPTLQQLTDEGLVRSEESDGRRVYELTDEGRARASERTGPAPWEEAAEESDEDVRALWQQAMGVMHACREVSQNGSKSQIESALEIVRDARKGLYRLLADD
jgi:DNA-binding PadR family transcriptional regulator